MILWNRTPGGMKFKETSKGSGEEVAEGSEEVVTIAYTAKVMNTDNVFERRTRENPLTLALNDREQAIFREAVAGMAVGGTRGACCCAGLRVRRRGQREHGGVRDRAARRRGGPGGLRPLRRLPRPLPPRDRAQLRARPHPPRAGDPGDAATLAQAGDAAAAAASAAPEMYNRWVGDLSAIGL